MSHSQMNVFSQIFAYVSHARGCKLDPRLISALVERWRLETHTFYLPCSGCTITLEDVALQLGLLMDRSAIKEAAVFPGKEDLCLTLLGKVLNKFDSGLISMNWLMKKFNKLLVDVIEVSKEQYA
ncbi:hypothetical protein PVK06_008271 [Gossypium arboreum]|uniref:Aminotransferase-like plant mobile domain-containing protein n=1 Tax=Gossypium arboreum TaxID=29729 RepID=A0ABR0QJI1_GOSAR|nr:hypothetical protein PVK06_008271 [Gossypium arboreum]